MPESPTHMVAGRTDLTSWGRNRPTNFLDADPNMQRVLQMHMGEEYHSHWPMLNRTASLAATSVDEMVNECSRTENLPTLRRYDACGNRKEDVVFHPLYHSLGAMVWSTAVLSVLRNPGSELLSGSLTYLLSHNGEGGHICPVACTAGLIKLLLKLGTPIQREHYLPQLLTTDYSRRVHASQFVTEVQGGSDVGLNECKAEFDGVTGLYRIQGEKWFCSVADASVFVVTARYEEGSDGTSGLGLFLVPRMVNGEVNDFAIRRLKDKFGTRALATAEIDFFSALAEPIGPLEDGFRNLVSIVLDTSRTYNAVASCGMMRRAYVEAQTYSQYRKAFGRSIIQYPAVQRLLARMKTLTAAAVSTTFRLLRMGDRIAGGEGSEDLQSARRIHVMINKYWTAVACSQVVRDGIEVLGGNGTIEDFSVLPRLYRDALVMETWEGTHNTLCAQVLRDFLQRQLHTPWLAEVGESLMDVEHPELEQHAGRAAARLEQISWHLQQLMCADQLTASSQIRDVVDEMCALNAYVSLLLEADWELKNDKQGDKLQIVEFFRLFYIDRVDPLEVSELGALQKALSSTF